MNIESIAKTSAKSSRDLVILEQIEREPEMTQASLAAQIGVAVGTVNWHLKRLIEKGYVKVRRIERRKLRYIITPEGLALRARLMVGFIHSSLDLYRLVRDRSMKAIEKIKNNGHASVHLIGEGDIAEIFRLTCLEQGIQISEDENAPTMKVIGLKIFSNLEVTDEDDNI
ncbi:MAG TPA: winged helix-turn-helix transcriptional regulator [Anaerolineae bacterium]|nr:winged helix-turn-helix transcriptional regulator [Anaerolineae bacterium]